MKTILKTLPVYFVLLMVFGTVLAYAQEVHVKNHSSYAGGGRWDWTVYIDADAKTLKQIACVEYRLHPTFPNPLRKVCRPDTKFSLSGNGWGTFVIPVKIIYRDEHVRHLEHTLVFEEKRATSRLNAIPKNRSRKIGEGWWEWELFIDGREESLAKIHCVEYTLHKSFPNPVRMVCSRDNKFLLTERSWGKFTVKIRLILNDGSIRHMSHLLHLN